MVEVIFISFNFVSLGLLIKFYCVSMFISSLLPIVKPFMTIGFEVIKIVTTKALNLRHVFLLWRIVSSIKTLFLHLKTRILYSSTFHGMRCIGFRIFFFFWFFLYTEVLILPDFKLLTILPNMELPFGCLYLLQMNPMSVVVH